MSSKRPSVIAQLDFHRFLTLARLATILFGAYVMIFASLTYFLFMPFHAELLGLSLLLLPLGLVVARVYAPANIRTPGLHQFAAGGAVLFLVLVPRAVTLALIDRSANAISGHKHCFYQSELTRNVDDLSFSSMLQTGSRIWGPPYVVLVTADQTWLWSFRSIRFVPWQPIHRTGTAPILDGRETIGRPSVEQIAKCLDIISNES